MNSLVLLIPLSILILVGAGIALFWAIDHGQFDDMEAGSLLPVVDADPAATEPATGQGPVESAGEASAMDSGLTLGETRGSQ